jgi:transposase InsO family protein
MQQVYIKSFYRGYNRGMDSIRELEGHPQEKEIRRRLQILEFFKKHGAATTQEAFGVGRSTVYEWQKRLREGGGKLVSLAPRSREPYHKRKREVDKGMEEFIKAYRRAHPRVGKVTVHPALETYCQKQGIQCPSESTVGRILQDLRKRGELQEYLPELRMSARSGKLFLQKKKPRIPKIRRKGYQPQVPGDLVQMDSIMVFVEGIKRYLLTAIDLKTGFAFAYAYASLSSQAATDFLERFLQVTPFPIRRLQTDNGSEFEKHFRDAVRKKHLIHFHTYPRHPQSNAHIERFNRTLQEQYLQWHLEALEDLPSFNHDLMNYLLWYNTEKPHQAKNKLPPLKFFLQSFILDTLQSNMLWTLHSSMKCTRRLYK